VDKLKEEWQRVTGELPTDSSSLTFELFSRFFDPDLPKNQVEVDPLPIIDSKVRGCSFCMIKTVMVSSIGMSFCVYAL
jgi:hypothetical protein